MRARKLRKLVAGLQRFGVRYPLTAFPRLMRLKCSRSGYGVVVTRSDKLVVHFRHPEQLVSTLVLFGEFVEPEYDLLGSVLSRDCVFVDVGAGIGTYSMSVAKTLCKEIHAFEPLQINVDTMRINLVANILEARVVLNACALSSAPGHGTMSTNSIGNIFGSFLEDVSERATAESIPVTTLDLYCRSRGIEGIDVLKIDAEGHESRILDGARELLDANRIGMMILETEPKQIAFYRNLSERGFRFFYYDIAVRELQPIDPLTRENLENMEPTAFSSNIVLIHDCRLSEIIARLAGERDRT